MGAGEGVGADAVADANDAPSSVDDAQGKSCGVCPGGVIVL